MHSLVKLYSLGTTICKLQNVWLAECSWKLSSAACFPVAPAEEQIWDCSKSSLQMLLRNTVKDEDANCSGSPWHHPDTRRRWDWQGINSIPCSTLLTDQLTGEAQSSHIFWRAFLLKKWEKLIDIFVCVCWGGEALLCTLGQLVKLWKTLPI